MSAGSPILLLAAGALAVAGSAAAQIPPPAAVASPAPAAAPAFPPGAEVLSVEGESLGVLAGVETRPGGERILHIRRADGSMTTAPAVVAFRGERAVILDWTAAEARADATARAKAAAPPAAEARVPPLT